MKIFLAIVAVIAACQCIPLERSLQDDLNDFKELIPVEEIEQLFLDYLTSDEEFQEALEYLTSEEFVNLITEVEKMQEVREGLQFLEDLGIPAYSYVNQINEFLEIPPIQRRRFVRSVGGIRGFLDAVEKMLPLDKIEELYNEKNQPNTDFHKLVEKLSSQDAQNVVNKLMVHPKFQELLQKAKEHKIDVDLIMNLITKILGLKFPGQKKVTPVVTPVTTLREDLQEFLEFIPASDIKLVWDRYYENDVSFRSALDYLLGNEIRDIVKMIEDLPETETILNYLEKNDIPAREALEEINEFLANYNEDEVSNEESNEIFLRKKLVPTVGVNGFLAEVETLVPVKQLKKLVKEKLATSPAFNDMVIHLRNKDGQAFITKIKTDPKVQEYVNEALAYGLDMKSIAKKVGKLLGIKK